jgi:hypothetical protein
VTLSDTGALSVLTPCAPRDQGCGAGIVKRRRGRLAAYCRLRVRLSALALAPRLSALTLAPNALSPATSLGHMQIARACGRVNSSCQNLLERLAFEEQHLLPLAQRILPTDAWFKIGTEFLLQDAQEQGTAPRIA